MNGLWYDLSPSLPGGIFNDIAILKMSFPEVGEPLDLFLRATVDMNMDRILLDKVGESFYALMFRLKPASIANIFQLFASTFFRGLGFFTPTKKPRDGTLTPHQQAENAFLSGKRGCMLYFF
jgi:hypothetical protein